MIRRLIACAAAALAVSAGLVVAPPGVVPGSPTPAQAWDNGLARTPPMGWNDWYTFFCDIDEELIKQTADAMVASGMRDAGYEYVNLDDCWMDEERDAQGRLQADPEKFPSGIAALADYVHARGLKLGIYEDVGTETCQGYPGSLGHEEIDARTFAEWGVDFVKVDWCNVPFDQFPGMSQQEVAQELYGRWHEAIKNSGRDMLFSICVWDPSVKSWEWAPPLSNMWRTSHDYGDDWNLIMRNFDRVIELGEYAGPGAWNDPDILMVGLGNLSDTEYRTHFSLWSMVAAPLLAGNDLRNMSEATLETLTNREVIAIDQDPLGEPGVRVRSGDTEVITRPLANGDRAVLLLNRTGRTQTIRTTAEEVGMERAGSYRLRDLWAHTTRQTAGEISASVPPHGVAMFRLSTGFTLDPAVTVDASAEATLDAGADGTYLAPGEPTTVTAVVHNDGYVPTLRTEASLRVPEGWAVEPAGDRRIGLVRGRGHSDELAWTVTPPAAAPAGRYDLTVEASYWTPAGHRVERSPVAVHVPPPPPTEDTWLSDVDWLVATNGYGPVLRDRNYQGNPLSIHGTTYDKGLWTHPYGEITYYLGGQCDRLTADVGIDDSTGGRGSVVYQVSADGTTVFDSGVVTADTPTVEVDADLAGAESVTLTVTDAGDGISYDNADWGGARLHCS